MTLLWGTARKNKNKWTTAGDTDHDLLQEELQGLEGCRVQQPTGAPSTLTANTGY